MCSRNSNSSSLQLRMFVLIKPSHFGSFSIPSKQEKTALPKQKQTILALFLYFTLVNLPDTVSNSVRFQGFFFFLSVRVCNSVNARSKMDINEVIVFKCKAESIAKELPL